MHQTIKNQQPSDRRTKLWDKIWKDRRGKTALFQAPNIWIIIWALARVGSLFTTAMTTDVLRWIATITLAVWAVLEITTGINYFRRGLGVVVLVLTIKAVL